MYYTGVERSQKALNYNQRVIRVDSALHVRVPPLPFCSSYLIPKSLNCSFVSRLLFFGFANQAQEATIAALRDGNKLLEVEFPPLSAEDMADSASSGNMITAANLRLAIDFSKRLVRDGKQVALMVPDADELEVVEEYLGTLEPSPNMTIRAVRRRSSESAESMADLFFGIFTRTK